MKLYGILLKSHTLAPDFEEESYHKSKKDAVDFYYSILQKSGWDRETIKDNVFEIDVPNLMEI